MNNRCQTIVIEVLLCLFVACVLFLNLVSLGHFLNSDMYGDLWVAKLMWEQKTFFPSDFVFGNQIYILATPNLTALLFGLTGNMLLSGSIASVIMLLLFFQSFYWLLSAFSDKKLIRLSFLVFFSLFIAGVLPQNQYAQLFLTGTTFYLCYAITLLIVLGVYIRLFNRQSVSKWLIVVSVFLSFVMGLQSARQTCIQVIPLCVYEACLYCYYKYKKREYSKKTGLFVIISSIANLFGLLVSRQFTVQREAIYGELGFNLFTNMKSKLVSTLACFKGLFGLDDVYYSFAHGSPSFILIPQVLLSLCLILFIVIALIVFVKKAKTNIYTDAFSLIMILTLSILSVLATFWVLEISALSKYLFVFFLLIPIIYVYVDKVIRRKTLLYNMTFLVAMISLFSAYIPAVIQTFSPTVYDNISDYMLENDKNIVYSTWNHAGRVAGASRCNILAGRWDASEIFKIKSHTNIVGIYSQEDNKKAAYLFDEETLKQAKEFFGSNNFESSGFQTFYDSISNQKIYLYFSSKQLMY